MSTFKKILAEVEMSRRGFLKVAGAAAVIAATKPATILANSLVSSPTASVSSLDILSSFMNVVPKIGISMNTIGQMMGQWSSGSEYEWWLLTHDEQEELRKKLSPDTVEPDWGNLPRDSRGQLLHAADAEIVKNYHVRDQAAVDKYYNALAAHLRNDEYAGSAEQLRPRQFGMKIEPLEKANARSQFYEKILGHKTKHTMLNDWAKSLGYPTFEHLYSSPQGKIIFDNIRLLSNKEDEDEDEDEADIGNHAPYDPVNHVYYPSGQFQYDDDSKTWLLRKDYDKSKYSGKVTHNARAGSTTDLTGSQQSISPDVQAAVDTTKTEVQLFRLFSTAITIAKKLLLNKSAPAANPTAQDKTAPAANLTAQDNTQPKDMGDVEYAKDNTLALPAPEAPNTLDMDTDELQRIKDLSGIKKKF